MKKLLILSLSFVVCIAANADSKSENIINKLKDPIFNKYISSEDVFYKDLIICGKTKNIITRRANIGCEVLINGNYINYPYEVFPFLEHNIKMEDYEIEGIKADGDNVIIYFKYKKFKDLID